MKLANRVLIAVLLVTLAGTAAFGKTQKKRVMFGDNVTVNGTVVKAGTYDLVFDGAASELAVIKNGKVVARTPVHVQLRDRKARETQVRQRMVGNESEFLGITFGGSKEDIVVGSGAMQSGGTY